MIRYFGLSDIGCSRSSNEDSFALEPDLGLFLVADGMGGAQAGERASAIAVETIVDSIYKAAPHRDLEALVDAVRLANANVLQQASENSAWRGMGTTVVAVLADLPKAYVASVGDSRVYLFRQGQLERITSDQTWVNEIGRTLGLTKEQIETHPYRNVLTMAVGAQPNIEVHSYDLYLEPGDILLLCSDGLHGVVSEAAMVEILGSAEPVAEKTRQLIETALDNGGPDNITAVLLEEADSAS